MSSGLWWSRTAKWKRQAFKICCRIYLNSEYNSEWGEAALDRRHAKFHLSSVRIRKPVGNQKMARLVIIWPDKSNGAYFA